MSYILFSFLVIIIISSLTLAIEKLYHSNNGCYLLWKNRICCWQSLLWIFHVQNAYAPPTLNLHTLCPLQICDKCSPVCRAYLFLCVISDLQVLICLTSCAVLMFVVSFCLFRKDCFSLAMPVIHLWQLQKLCDTCKNPTAISQHVIFLPSLCAADGLNDCVFILSRKSAKKTLFSAELKLKPGKKLAKHSLAS